VAAQYWACSFTSGDCEWGTVWEQTGLEKNRKYNLFIGKVFSYATKSEIDFLLAKLPAYHIACFYPLCQR